MRYLLLSFALLTTIFLSSCSSTGGPGVNMSSGPSVEAREAAIKAEPKGSHYIGRRYFVDKTRFWGYVRKPGQSWSKAKLVVMNEDKMKSPDRFSEAGTGRQKYAFDANFEYKLYGKFTGEKIYDPNSNKFRPEFQLTGHSVIDENPGWLFRPTDRYDKKVITLIP